MERVILTPRELVLPEARTLEEDLIAPYKEEIAPYKEKARNSLDIFTNRNGDLAGSNCFAPLVLRKLLPTGTRLSTIDDLGRATEINPQFLRGFYSDTGLTLRTTGDSYGPNDFLARDLASQLKGRGIELKVPVVLYFDALDLREDSESAYGLAFNLSERAEAGKNIIEAPELTRDFRFRTMNGKGIPILDEKGNRICYTKQDGLSGFFLDRYSGVGSDVRDLAYSDLGRVVVVSAEGTAPKIDEYLTNLRSLRDRQIADVQERYAKAEAILKGK